MLLSLPLLVAAAATCGGRSNLDAFQNGGRPTTATEPMGGFGGLAGAGGTSGGGFGGTTSSTTSGFGGVGGTGGEGGFGGVGGGSTSSSASSSSSAASTASSASSSSGAMCVAMCTFDAECQSSCPPPPFGVNCCDTLTGVCYISSMMMCPGITSSSSSGSSGYGG
jgi:hypothetical protein